MSNTYNHKKQNIYDCENKIQIKIIGTLSSGNIYHVYTNRGHFF